MPPFSGGNDRPILSNCSLLTLQVNNSFRVMDGNSSTPWWLVMDGTENIIFKDIDGSVTGTKDTYIVQDRPFFTGIS